MTLQDLQRLSDEQLIEKVAVEVMGWTITGRLSDGTVMWNRGENRKKGERKHIGSWNPLASWEHTMEMVEEVRARGLPVKMHFAPVADKVTCSIRGNTLLEIRMQRAICIAAILALSPSHS